MKAPSSVSAPRSLGVPELRGPGKSLHDLAHVQVGAQAEKWACEKLNITLHSIAYICFLSQKTIFHLN